MEKNNIRLSALIESMREISSEGNRFVKGDAFHDVVRISKEVEELEEYDIEDEYKECHWFWCLRRNGTSMCSSKRTVEEFGKEYPEEAVKAYKIVYKNRRFSIALVREFGNYFFD